MANSRESKARIWGGRWIVGAIAASLVLTSLVADASVLRGLTAKELRQGADAIVAGRVVNVRTVRTEGRIETLARVRVEQAWRGESKVLTVRALGGYYRGKRLIVPGAATFRRGDQVLLFLYRDGDDWRPVGMFQGVWRIDSEDPSIVRPSHSGGAALVRPASGAPAVDRAERPLAGLVGAGGGR